jgi:hypothetical protein
MPKVFHDNDEGFLGWRNANPTGFVVSCAVEPRTAYVILHQTKCEVLAGDPPRGEHWTSPQKKVCGDSVTELEDWSRSAVGTSPQRCGSCLWPSRARKWSVDLAS